MIRTHSLQPVLRTGAPPAQRAATPRLAPPGPSFQQVLGEVTQPALPTVRFSAHAQQRLIDRGLQLPAETLDALETAVAELDARGARESVVLTSDTALIISVKNRTVITAMSAHEAQGNVITNIDSLLVLPKTAAPGTNETHGQDPFAGGPGAAERQTRRTQLEI